MATGACGINCDVCKLQLMEICSSCGSGKSLLARQKLAAQERILGGVCPILACASMKNLDYCMRDCSSFPCDHFTAGPYPFSRGFLAMQERRRQEQPPALTHNKTPIQVPAEYWDSLESKNIADLCNFTLFSPHPPEGMTFRCLRDDVLIDIGSRCLKRLHPEGWIRLDDPLLELVTLLYLNHVNGLYPLGKDIVGPQDLKEAHYFKGRHALKTEALLDRYGNDLDGFKRAAQFLDGKARDMADAAYMLLPFPRVALYYLLWEGDEEFSPKLSVLFDRSIENYLSGSGIWSLVSYVSGALLRGPESGSKPIPI
ncbi:DUF3786 domain-containing protein [Desulfoferrobacter suflitae]|uniref:DUF3786 domain-containing protein n=1 Tax=Desulfoferrobacter suflitae TaxID=2865782 RepID=UPI00216423E1|nr:DUF3786 domain-containing protein [Desulfoferrobacter suflitae]MCK8600919.1 DUF3786 domain-containing protein [Desulfoferrobacter suflitae]